jgi:MraZ protein
MLLTGQFQRSIDQKLRIAIPKRFRAEMECPEGASLYIAPGTDGSLALYSEAAFQRLADRLEQSPPTRQDVRAFTRLFYARAERVEVDQQGRVRIPPGLAGLAELKKEAVLLGVQDHLELWSTERWQAYLAEKQADYDRFAETAFGAREPDRPGA